ncbi:MAG: phage Gp37/Gp68 family protein [Spirochaetaceae bacterium]|jgi:DNA repair photolyase|nr:phage Gp37/Gp68 family protein [Spirochaetaceae bacterium]
MAVRESRGNMYGFIDFSWNPVRGKCPYDCAYCYVKRWGDRQKPLHIDRSFLNVSLGKGNFVFVCSGCDLFHPDTPEQWIAEVRKNALRFPDNKYLWHTKNPQRLVELIEPGPNDFACATIESNIHRPCVGGAPPPSERTAALREWKGPRMVTVEPVMDFETAKFADMILSCKPAQVNIGADSGKNGLPEPSPDKVRTLVHILEQHTAVYVKPNLRRLMPEGLTAGEGRK